MTKVKIGFDFDRIFVSYPPFVPSWLIENLYKYRSKKKGVTYRIPGKAERKIREISHASFLRSPIKPNVTALKKIFTSEKYEIYLVSSRFSFLKKQTKKWDEKNKLSKYFEKMYFNFTDKQPNVFKDEIIKKEKITKFVDDDLDLLSYLSEKNPEIDFYWLSPKKKIPQLPPKIKHIKNLDEFRRKYL